MPPPPIRPAPATVDRMSVLDDHLRAELQAELEAVEADDPGLSKADSMRVAHLLVVLGRVDEALVVLGRAKEAWRPPSESGWAGTTSWDAWNTEAAIALSRAEWGEAEGCAQRVLIDFGEECMAGELYELALHAQGRLSPERVIRFCRDPETALRDFDLVRWVLPRLKPSPPSA